MTSPVRKSVIENNHSKDKKSLVCLGEPGGIVSIHYQSLILLHPHAGTVPGMYIIPSQDGWFQCLVSVYWHLVG